MKKYYFLLVFLPSVVFAQASIHEKYGLPSDENIINKKYFIVSYNNDFKIPNWTAYHLSKKDLEKSLKRNGRWKIETKVPVEYRATTKDYQNSGYDKGHLCPSNDFSKSLTSMNATFVYSNSAPQVGKGFNQAIWRYLEDQVREWAKAKGDVWIYTGVYFDGDSEDGTDNASIKYIGNGVGVPPHWVKVVYAPNGPTSADDEVIAFAFENKAYSGKDFMAHTVTVREIEEETGWDFLNKLPKAVQEKLETQKVVGNWN